MHPAVAVLKTPVVYQDVWEYFQVIKEFGNRSTDKFKPSTYMPFVKAWMHLVWATKNREPLLHDDIREQVFTHMRENAHLKKVYVDFINGYRDHVHCLVSLGVDQAISKTVQLLKGESSWWINKQSLIKDHFEWQDEYFAVSVSESQVDAVRGYIKKQEEHHKHKTFQQEYDEFISKYGFKQFG